MSKLLFSDFVNVPLQSIHPIRFVEQRLDAVMFVGKKERFLCKNPLSGILALIVVVVLAVSNALPTLGLICFSLMILV